LRKPIDVGDLLDLNLRITKSRLLDVRKALKSAETDPEYKLKLYGKLNELARTVVVLSAEERKRDKAVKRAVDKMSAEDRLALVQEFIKELAPDSRAQLRALLDSLEGGSIL
jgi:hypothetical protein